MAATPLLSKNAYLRIGERLYSLYEEEYGEDKAIKKLDSIEILDLYKERGSKWISPMNFGEIHAALKQYNDKTDPELSKVMLNTYSDQLEELCRLHGLIR